MMKYDEIMMKYEPEIGLDISQAQISPPWDILQAPASGVGATRQHEGFSPGAGA